jgi:hypothetical protein
MPRVGNTSDRGYGRAHEAQRRAWAPRVARGETTCAKCHAAILPSQAWDMGHTDDRTAWTGPEHASCNRSAGARMGQAKQATTTRHSRVW